MDGAKYVEGSEFRHFRVPTKNGRAPSAFGFRVPDFGLSGFRFVSKQAGASQNCNLAPGVGCRVSGFGFRVSGFGFRVSGFISRVSGVVFRAPGFGFRDSGPDLPEIVVRLDCLHLRWD